MRKIRVVEGTKGTKDTKKLPPLPKPSWLPPIQLDKFSLSIAKRSPSAEYFHGVVSYGCAAEAWADGKTREQTLVDLFEDINRRIEKLETARQIVEREIEKR